MPNKARSVLDAPCATRGILLVMRDQASFSLINMDRCTSCGQTVIYTDPFIGGERVVDASSRPPTDL
jgi:hypothetical protein